MASDNEVVCRTHRGKIRADDANTYFHDCPNGRIDIGPYHYEVNVCTKGGGKILTDSLRQYQITLQCWNAVCAAYAYTYTRLQQI